MSDSMPKISPLLPPTISTYGLFRYTTSSERHLVRLAAALSVINGLFTPLAVLVLGIALSKFAQPGSFNGAKGIVSVMGDIALQFIGLAIGSALTAYGSRSCWVFTAEKQAMRMRTRYLESALHQEIQFFDEAKEGSLISRLTKDISKIQHAIGENTGRIFTSSGTLVLAFLIAFAKGWRLALVLIACMPIFLVPLALLGRKQARLLSALSLSLSHTSKLSEQAFSAIRTVHAFSLIDRFAQKLDEQYNNSSQKLTEKLRGVETGLFLGILFAIFGLTFWYGSRLVIQSDMQGTDVVVSLFCMMLSLLSLMSIPTTIAAWNEAKGSAQSVFNIIQTMPIYHPLPSTDLSGQITFERVSFAYPTRSTVPILREFSLDIQKGQTVAFVGQSGSGKSTIVALLQRFYAAQNGRIMVDGKPIQDVDIHEWRQAISVVGQEPVLFNLTIRQNILMGVKGKVSEEWFLQVCKMAECHDFISKFPNKYDTMVGSSMLSGGQKQRIAIARSLINNPKILLLDESTSALDTQSERQVQKALDNASASRTTIVIAHRLSTIRHADVIVVMNRGSIIEKGTHESLLAQNGHYSNLVAKQRISVTENDSVRAAAVIEDPSAGPTSQNKDMIQLDSLDDLVAAAGRKFKDDKSMRKVQGADSLGDSPTRRVLREMRPNIWSFVQAMLAAFLNGLVFPLFGVTMALMIVAILSVNKADISPGAVQGANLWGLCFGIVGVLAFFANYWTYERNGQVNAATTKRLRVKLFRNILTQEIAFFDNPQNSTGALSSRLIEAGEVVGLVTMVWTEALSLVLTAILGIGIGFVLSPRLTGIMMALSPMMIFSAWHESNSISKYASKTKSAFDDSQQVAAESLRDIRTIRSLDRADFVMKRYKACLTRPHQLAIKDAFVVSIGYAITAATPMAVIALGLYAGAQQITYGNSTFRNMIISIMGILITTWSASRAGGFTTTYSKGVAAAENTYSLLSRKTKLEDNDTGFKSHQLDSEYDFRDIQFTYPSRPEQMVLKGKFNLKGLAGKTMAIVGPSGSGKSTVIGLLLRFYDQDSGELMLGSRLIKDYNLTHGLRRHIALVSQEPTLFDLTIGENIRWGALEEVTDNKVEEAAKKANIHDFIISLPEKYETRVGDQGTQLSGGQRQRIAIARALIRQPALLLLDEATSALDSESEKIVQEALDAAKIGRTTIIIAHRLSSIVSSDCIAVVQNGAVVEIGTHEELFAMGGVYTELVRLQNL